MQSAAGHASILRAFRCLSILAAGAGAVTSHLAGGPRGNHVQQVSPAAPKPLCCWPFYERHCGLPDGGSRNTNVSCSTGVSSRSWWLMCSLLVLRHRPNRITAPRWRRSSPYSFFLRHSGLKTMWSPPFRVGEVVVQSMETPLWLCAAHEGVSVDHSRTGQTLDASPAEPRVRIGCSFNAFVVVALRGPRRRRRSPRSSTSSKGPPHRPRSSQARRTCPCCARSTCPRACRSRSR